MTLQQMSYDELVNQAEVLGVSTDDKSEEDLRAAIQAALDGGSEVNEAPKPQKKRAARTTAKKDSADPMSQTVRVVVEESETDRQPAYVGLNGRSYRIKRGIEVDVPKPVADILLTSKQKHRNADGSEREVPTYPTRVVA